MSKTYDLNIQSSVADMYENYTRYNYTECYALAEFIDNSTSSFYLNESRLIEAHSPKLTVEINYDKITNTLTIYDDAFGMNREEFDVAMIAGKKPKIISRNEYGYGLKTAATWFGRRWTVETTQYGSENKYFGVVDLDELRENNSNTIKITETPEKYESHYTKITISKMSRPLNTQKIKNDIIKFLNSIYRRDLITGKIEILYNGVTLSFSEYEPLIFKGQEYKKNISFSFECNGNVYKVNGFVGILKKGSFDNAGFILLRNNRGIITNFKPNEIFIQAQNPISKNLYGELDMSDFDVNQTKDGFSWSPDVKEEFIKVLKQTIIDYIKVAKMTNKDRDKDELEYQNSLKVANDDDDNVVDVEDINKKEPLVVTEFPSINNEEPQDSKSYNPNNNKQPSSSLGNKIDQKNENIDNSLHNETDEIIRDLCFFDIQLDSIIYHISWKKMDGWYFLYKYTPESNSLIVNLNHPYAYKCLINSRVDVSKLLMGYILAVIEAQKVVNEDGYVSSSKIKNGINNILNNS